MNREQLSRFLRQYTTPFPAEAPFIQLFLELLSNPRAYFRDNLPGHVTGSAWITNPARTHVLLTHHAKLRRWLQPGGHADGDEDILAVSRREGEEESGLPLSLACDAPLDVDIHPIPARVGFPEHLHYDVRFWFTADSRIRPVASAESTEVQWVPIEDISSVSNQNESMLRMLEKTRKTGQLPNS
jgi:8-oxo-dGTP pyrophosphatase MutT (NUDIX family)